MLPGCLTEYPQAPTALRANVQSTSQVLLTWNRPSGNPCIQKYRVGIVEYNAATKSRVNGAQPRYYDNVGDFQFTVTGLYAGRTYQFFVQSYNSAYSNIEAAPGSGIYGGKFTSTVATMPVPSPQTCNSPPGGWAERGGGASAACLACAPQLPAF